MAERGVPSRPLLCSLDFCTLPLKMLTLSLLCTRSLLSKNKTRQQRPGRRIRRAATGPDDFIDTTAVDVPGSSLGVDFERQELRVIFETMDRNNIFYKMLSEEQIVREHLFFICRLLWAEVVADSRAGSDGEALWHPLTGGLHGRAAVTIVQ